MLRIDYKKGIFQISNTIDFKEKTVENKIKTIVEKNNGITDK